MDRGLRRLEMDDVPFVRDDLHAFFSIQAVGSNLRAKFLETRTEFGRNFDPWAGELCVPGRISSKILFVKNRKHVREVGVNEGKILFRWGVLRIEDPEDQVRLINREG